MENKEELLQYLETNWFIPGHPFYQAGVNIINFLFDGNLPTEDIYNFLEHQRSHTG